MLGPTARIATSAWHHKPPPFSRLHVSAARFFSSCLDRIKTESSDFSYVSNTQQHNINRPTFTVKSVPSQKLGLNRQWLISYLCLEQKLYEQILFAWQARINGTFRTHQKHPHHHTLGLRLKGLQLTLVREQVHTLCPSQRQQTGRRVELLDSWLSKRLV